MKLLIYILVFVPLLHGFVMPNQTNTTHQTRVQMVITAADGKKLQAVSIEKPNKIDANIVVNPKEKFQKIVGIGGSFTQSTSYLLTQLSENKKNEILEAYFGEKGAQYSLCRTHINSCDFSLSQYAYVNDAKDEKLESFSIKPDQEQIIPIIKQAQKIAKYDFKLIASPWTAPPYMKDNNQWKGGKLLPQFYPQWALYFVKYIQAYQKENINIWGVTFQNEPLGNDNNWESMHFNPQEMNEFVTNYLKPSFTNNAVKAKILGYDQNRDDEMKEWANAMYTNSENKSSYDGMAIHWYASTFDYFPESLNKVHQLAPNKHLIQTEACIDAEKPRWNDDAWYWNKEAKDWGWTWAPENKKHLHPKYAPVNRYAQDIIGCLNNWVDGWIDWNMVLDENGGPNWAKNWCTAPVIVNTKTDEVYYTPLYYILSQFSRNIAPNAQRIGITNSDKTINCTAVENPDGSIAIFIFNEHLEAKGISLTIHEQKIDFTLQAQALQTLIIH